MSRLASNFCVHIAMSRSVKMPLAQIHSVYVQLAWEGQRPNSLHNTHIVGITQICVNY